MKLIYTNDDVGAGGKRNAEAFKDTLKLLKKLKIKATFFWIPRPGGKLSWKRKEWEGGIKMALEEGHDFQLHGFEHKCLEFGRPPEIFHPEMPSIFNRYALEPERWEREWKVERLFLKIKKAKLLYEEVFEKAPLIFRAPCFGTSPGMYEALYRAGINASSSTCINPKSWLYTVTYFPENREYQEEFPPYPRKVPPGVVEYPTVADYTHWGISEYRLKDLLELARRDFSLIKKKNPPLIVLLGHYHTMHKNWSLTFKFYIEFFAWIKDRGWGEFTTFQEFLKENGRKV